MMKVEGQHSSAEGARIEAPSGVGFGEGGVSPSPMGESSWEEAVPAPQEIFKFSVSVCCILGAI